MSREPWVGLVLVWTGFALLPLAVPGWVLAELAQYLCYGLLAASLALVWGQAGILCFGQALFFGAGAYAFGLVSTGVGPLPPLSPWLGLLGSVLVPPLLAALLGAMLFYGRGARGAFLALITLAIGVIAERVAVNSPLLGGSNGLVGLPALTLPLPGGSLELIDPLPLYVLAATAAAVVSSLLALLLRSAIGARMRAVRENESRAAHLGIDPRRVRLGAFALAAAIAGLGGGLFAAQLGFVGPPLLGFALSTEALVWVAVGGRGSPLAALLGAVLVRTGEARLAETLGPFWLLAVGTAFVAVAVALPRGVIVEVATWAGRWRRDS